MNRQAGMQKRRWRRVHSLVSLLRCVFLQLCMLLNVRPELAAISLCKLPMGLRDQRLRTLVSLWLLRRRGIRVQLNRQRSCWTLENQYFHSKNQRKL